MLRRSEMDSQLHTEFIYYTPGLPVCTFASSPTTKHVPSVHHFRDWGVATYGGGQAKWNSTFLSFKAGRVHGRVLNMLANGKVAGIVETMGFTGRLGFGQTGNLRPGHEHPDQGSLVYNPGGIPLM